MEKGLLTKVPNLPIIILQPNTFNLKPHYMTNNTLYSIDRKHFVGKLNKTIVKIMRGSVFLDIPLSSDINVFEIFN